MLTALVRPFVYLTAHVWYGTFRVIDLQTQVQGFHALTERDNPLGREMGELICGKQTLGLAS